MASKRPRTRQSKATDPRTLAAWDTLVWIAGIHHAHTNEFHSFTPRVWIPYKSKDGGWYAPATREDDASQIPEMIERGLWDPAILKTRASYIMVSLNEHLTAASQRNRKALQDPHPASPTRPPRICIYLRKKSADPHARMFAWPFAEFYAARRAVDCILQDHTTSWVDDNTMEVTFGEVTALLTTDAKPAGLTELIDYEFSPTELEWQPSSKFLGEVERMFRGYAPKVDDQPAEQERAPTPREVRAQRAEKPQREPKKVDKPSGLIDLATLLEGTDIDPKEARNALRKTNTPKPEHGWSWSKKDAPAMLTAIKAAVKKLRKK